MPAAQSKEYPNFYENIKEAQMRLQHTVVLYDKEPYFVLTVADGKPDGIFRMYMEPIGSPSGGVLNNFGDVPTEMPEHLRMAAMDDWMAKYPTSGVIRKMMNSPLFNKYRPFDLGMCNSGGSTVYLERQPQRHTQQGLTQNMLCQNTVGIENPSVKPKRVSVQVISPEMRTCIMGEYPDFNTCVKNLLDPDIMNDTVAFSRHFAIARGPIDTLFLAYKSDVVGCMPYGDASLLRIASKFRHAKEVTEELGIFKNIVIN